MSESLRVDKWLWHARFCKSRTLAAKLAASGKLRIAGTLISKAHHAVKPGDILTFPLGLHIRHREDPGPGCAPRAGAGGPAPL